MNTRFAGSIWDQLFGNQPKLNERGEPFNPHWDASPEQKQAWRNIDPGFSPSTPPWNLDPGFNPPTKPWQPGNVQYL